jgi:serine/threonine protein kinase
MNSPDPESTVSSDRHRRAGDLFLDALARPAPERLLFLSSACAADPAMLEEVQSLLDAHARADGFLVTPLIDAARAPSEPVARVLEYPANLFYTAEKDRRAKLSPESEETKTFVAVGPGLLLKDRYLIVRELNRGGFGTVFLAYDQHLHGKTVVIKLRNDALGNDAWFERKFSEEVRALALIEHPGVVGALDHGKLPDGRPFLVMQYVEGKPLRSVMVTEGMPLDRVANIVQQIGAALSAAHEKKVWHRDLKPENIMLQKLSGGADHVRLIDFGISTIDDLAPSLKRADTRVAGSLGYMAPEQLEGQPSAATDIYAFGVIAYEMITGRKPFLPQDIMQLVSLQRAGVRIKPADLRPELSQTAQKLLLQALSYNPRDRPGDALEFGDQLAQALRENSAAGDFGRVAAKAAGRRKLILLMVAVVAVIALTTWLLISTSHNARTRTEAARGSEMNSTAEHGAQTSNIEIELTFWNSIKDENRPELFASYLAKYPAGQFASLARFKLNQLGQRTSSGPLEDAPVPAARNGAASGGSPSEAKISEDTHANAVARVPEPARNQAVVAPPPRKAAKVEVPPVKPQPTPATAPAKPEPAPAGNVDLMRRVAADATKALLEGRFADATKNFDKVLIQKSSDLPRNWEQKQQPLGTLRWSSPPFRHENSEFVWIEFERGVIAVQFIFAKDAVSELFYQWRSQHPEAPPLTPATNPPSPQRAREASDQGNRLMQQQNYKEAERRFAEALTYSTDFEPAYQGHCAALDRLRDYRRAMLDCVHAIHLAPDDAYAYRWLGDSVVGDSVAGSGLWYYAMAMYDQAILLKPDDNVFYNQRAWAHSNLQQFEACVEDATAGIRLTLINKSLWNNRSHCYNKLGKSDLAIDDATRLVNLSHDAVDLNTRGRLYSDAKDYAHAIADFNEAIRLKPDFREAYNNRGFAKDMLGDSQGAAADRRYALELGK